MAKYRIGFLGFGNMAGAIARALTAPAARASFKRAGIKAELWAFDVEKDKVSAAGVQVLHTAQGLSACDMVILAVKPQAAAEAVQGLELSNRLVVSIMAGVTIAELKRLTGAVRLVRAMPNLNACVAASCTAYCAEGLTERDEWTVRTVLESFGECHAIEEPMMHAATGLCGSGPAFVFSFIRGLTDAGIKLGLTPLAARRMAISTVIGSAYTLEGAPSIDIGTRIEAVCSKGGTTIEGMKALIEGGFEAVVASAVGAAAARAKELEAGK